MQSVRVVYNYKDVGHVELNIVVRSDSLNNNASPVTGVYESGGLSSSPDLLLVLFANNLNKD